MSERRGILLVFAAALLWSSGGIGVKAVTEPALEIACYRSLVAAVVLLFLFRPRRPRLTPAFLVAVISYATCLTTFVVATKWTTAANAIFLQYSGVAWVLVLSPLVLREPLRRADVIATSVAFGGMALFFVERLELRGMSGNLMGLVSGFFFAMLVLALRKEKDLGAEAAVTWGNVVTALVLFPFVAAGDPSVDAKSGIILVLLGTFQIAVAYALFVRGLRVVSATQASLTSMIEPVANPIWVFLFLGEEPSRFAILGGAIVLIAVAWRTVTVGPPPEPEMQIPD
ncbi:MAG TPA: DMT family transporter [Thermoanaerobaculia bacterium]|nr:DMT family transporter [Thermoanaerobaculia bacterium]